MILGFIDNNLDRPNQLNLISFWNFRKHLYKNVRGLVPGSLGLGTCSCRTVQERVVGPLGLGPWTRDTTLDPLPIGLKTWSRHPLKTHREPNEHNGTIQPGTSKANHSWSNLSWPGVWLLSKMMTQFLGITLGNITAK